MPTEIPCSNRSGPHPTRLIVVIVALSIGTMANSGGPHYYAEVIEQPDDFEITVVAEGCLPRVEAKPPVHRIAISTEKGEKIAWVECSASTDCINEVSFTDGKERCELDTGNTGARDNARDDARSDDADAGDAARSCWVHEDWIVASEDEKGRCKTKFTMTFELADDTVFEATYKQSYVDNDGYINCSVAAPGRSPQAIGR